MTVYVTDGKSGRGARLVSDTFREMVELLRTIGRPYLKASIDPLNGGTNQCVLPLAPSTRILAIDAGAIPITINEFIYYRTCMLKGTEFELRSFRERLHHGTR